MFPAQHLTKHSSWNALPISKVLASLTSTNGASNHPHAETRKLELVSLNFAALGPDLPDTLEVLSSQALFSLAHALVWVLTPFTGPEIQLHDHTSCWEAICWSSDNLLAAEPLWNCSTSSSIQKQPIAQPRAGRCTKSLPSMAECSILCRSLRIIMAAISS